MDLEDPKDIKRLMGAVEASFKALETPRQDRAKGIQNLVGSHFFPEGSSEKIPINLTALATTIYAQKLVGTAPQCLISTPYQTLKAEAKDFECITNHEIKRLDVEGSLREWVIEAIFGLGILKVGIADDGIETLENYNFEKTRPYVDVVLFEDFVFDVTAKRERNCQFMGHRYRIPLEEAKENEKFDKDERKKLLGISKQEMKDDGETSNMTDDDAEPDEYQDMVELWEIWLPFENQIVTIACDGENRKPLRVEDWEPPSAECRTGPYHILGFDDVPGNVLYLPPESLWRDLSDIANRLYNKIVRQAEDAKTVFLFRDETDAENIRKAGDGEFIRSNDPGNVVPVSVGAVDNNILATVLNAKDMFDFISNVSIMGGLGAQTSTVGQERLLNESSSDRINKYQKHVMERTSLVLRDLAFYIWENPIPYPRMNRPLNGSPVPMEVPVDFSKERRKGDFLDYNTDVVPFSMQQKSPGERLGFLMQTMSQLIPLQPQLAEQGISFDFKRITELLAQYGSTPELLDILVFSGPPNPAAAYEKGPKQPPASPPGGPSGPTRASSPGRTAPGQSKILQQTLVGGNPQGAERAMVGRAG
jgi:hypothetical protein